MGRFNILLGLVITCFAGGAIASDEQDQILRLEYTVEELTLKLAERTLENRRLTESLQAAVVASKRGEVVVLGCDLAKVNKDYAFGSNSVITQFLRTHGAECTKTQISEIYNTYGAGGSNKTSLAADKLLYYYKNL